MRRIHRTLVLLTSLFVPSWARSEEVKPSAAERPPAEAAAKRAQSSPAGPRSTTDTSSAKPALTSQRPPSSGAEASSPSGDSKLEGGSPALLQPPVLRWTELWSERVGALGSETSPTPGQIAARGSLVVVASMGTPGENDALDGVHVIDGSKRDSSSKDESRTLRLLRSPALPGSTSEAGSTDAVGVALDGDFVVFGTYAGLVTKRRLDGAEAWTKAPFTDTARPGLPGLVDLNRDQVLDVVIPALPAVACEEKGEACDVAELAVALDGVTGDRLWGLARPSHFQRCATLFAVDPTTQRVCVACGKEGSVCAGFDGQSISTSSDPEDAARFETDPLVVGIAEPRNLTYRLLPDKSALRVASERGATASYPLAPLFQPPSVADVDLDGSWDLLVASGDRLYALSTGAKGDAPRPLWRGDVQASGAPARIDTPAAYASRAEPRDRTRWLRRENASDDAFSQLDSLPPGVELLTGTVSSLPTRDDEANVVAELDCFDHYGLSEGRLVVQSSRGTWGLVQGAPWPLVALGCAKNPAGQDEALILKAADGGAWRMALPRPWWALFGALGSLVIAVAGATLYYDHRRNLATSSLGQSDEKPEQRVRKVVVTDAPLTRREQAGVLQTQLLEGLLAMLDNKDTRPPVTIALYGPWGSGKSSLMKILSAELGKTGRYIDVWFNAWRYHREKDLSAPLLQSIVAEVGRRTNPMARFAILWDRVRNATAREIMLTAAPPLALILLGLLAYRVFLTHFSASLASGTTLISALALFAGAVYRIANPLFKVFSLDPAKLLNSGDSQQRLDFVREFPAEFERINRQLPSDTRLILFIDDLDRCPPDRIVDVLETISMLADTGCGFFVLAIDPITIRRAIELKYKDVLRLARRERSPDATEFGERYLEKIITLGVHVPKIRPEHVQPDTRVPHAEPHSFLDWFKERVVPGPPLLVTGALVAGLVALGAYQPKVVGTVMDACGALLFSEIATPAPTPDPVSSTAPSDDAPPPEPVSQAAPASGTAPRASSAAAAFVPNRAGTAREPVRPAAPEPARVTSNAPGSPSLVNAAYELGRFAFTAVAGLSLLLCGWITWAEWKRRRHIKSSRPLGEDSPSFEAELRNAKQQLDVTPREIVRFTNASRLLFEIFCSAPEAPHHPSPISDADFFRLMLARWKREADPDAPPWMKEQMDLWMPSLRRGPRRAPVKQAAE